MGFVTIDDHHMLAHPQPGCLSQMMVYVKLGVTNTFPVVGCAVNQSLKMEVNCDESHGDLSGGWTIGGQTGEWDFLGRQWAVQSGTPGCTDRAACSGRNANSPFSSAGNPTQTVSFAHKLQDE